MASGKSSVGRALSRRCGWPRVDIDEEIVYRAGKPIADIFQDSGEAAFRELERTVVSEICAESGRIIAAGGGSFVDDKSRQIMLEGGTVIYLSTRPETILHRVTGGHPNAPVRPMLAGSDPLDRIKELLKERAPAYSQAHHILQTDNLTPDQVAEAILRMCGPGLLYNSQ